MYAHIEIKLNRMINDAQVFQRLSDRYLAGSGRLSWVFSCWKLAE